MFKFVKWVLTEYKDFVSETKPKYEYDDDGNLIDPKIKAMSESELIISADKARIMHSKAVEDVKLKVQKKVFSIIHGAIKNGKTQVRLEAYNTTAETLVYLESLGYGVRDVIPQGDRGREIPVALFHSADDDEEAETVPYHYYMISWAAPEVIEEIPASVV